MCTETEMFCGVWSYSRGNPCGGLANILQLFPETLLPLRQSFTATGGQVSGFSGFKFIFNKKAFSSHQNLLYWCYKNTPKMFWKKRKHKCLEFRDDGKKFQCFFYSKVAYRVPSFPFCKLCLIYLIIRRKNDNLCKPVISSPFSIYFLCLFFN